MAKKPTQEPETLIPEDDLKKVVRGLIAVPKEQLAKPKGKPERKKPKP